jgi:Leucine-rich repeat (LRR) protein
VDWFLAAASLPPLYHDILDLPETDRELERQLEINVARNIQTAPGFRVWRAGFNESGVSNHNRVVERHSSRYGAYWKSYDFAGSVGVQNVKTHPLSFEQDGGEVIFNLPNGLQAYYISDASGNRIDVAPTDIVSNPQASDPAVRNGISCIGCHTKGMKPFEDEVRSAILQTKNPAYDKDHALRLYVSKAEMDRYVAQDTAQYKKALEATEDVFGGLVEPVHRFYEVFQGSLDAPHAAAAVGMTTDAFLSEIRKKSSLQNLGLAGMLSGGNIQRDTWTQQFENIIIALNSEDDDDDLFDLDDDNRRHSFFDIPDANLRAAVALALNKTPDTLTQEDLQHLTRLSANGQGIRELTGLEYATKLDHIELRHNAISDLSPLAGLTRLHNIKLRGNRIRDLSPLARLTNVDWLGLEENEITDLSPLAGLKKLTGLGIHGNPVSDVSPLAGLISLEGINAIGTNISDFSPLAGLRRLRWLDVSETSSKSLDFVKPLKNLRKLDVREGRISDISALAGFTQLQVLNLDGNFISDVSPLSKLKGLRELYLRENLIVDVSPLSSLGTLEVLDLRDNAIADASPLEALINKDVVKWHWNPAFPEGGPMLKGPWLWVMLPDAGFLNGTDLLAEASEKKTTERNIATHGATEGAAVGNRVWTAHTLKTPGEENFWDNLTEMSKALEWSAGRVSHQVAYGSILITSPRAQETTLFAGSDTNHKVWLNGTLVGEHLNGWAHNYQAFYPVTFKQGTNVLLVAVHTDGGAFGGFFGFAPDAEYKVLPLGARFSFSTQTPRLSVGDTLTLNVRAEKVTDLAGYQTNITFNPDVLKANGVREGGFLKQAGGQTFFQKGRIQNPKGEITGIKTSRFKGGVSGDGTLLLVTFTAIAEGRTTVKLRNFQAGTPTGQTVAAFAPEISIQVGGGAISRPAWDVNEDGVTDAQDLLLVTLALGEKPPKNPRTDVNGDGGVDAKDAALVTEHLGEGNAPAAPLHAETLAQLTPEVVSQAIAFLNIADDGSAVYRDTIARLEALLVFITPENTQLLANYPNPFNPETWIPYQLSAPAAVTVSLYDMKGALIRRLTIGHQSAGYYTDRTRAAYWDGRNAVGEPVASGVYFYTLTAGDFTATRKLLIRK